MLSDWCIYVTCAVIIRGSGIMALLGWHSPIGIGEESDVPPSHQNGLLAVTQAVHGTRTPYVGLHILITYWYKGFTDIYIFYL